MAWIRLLGLGCLAVANSTSAQAPPSAPRMCLHPDRRPACHSYFITEVELGVVLAGGILPGGSVTDRLRPAATFGWAYNLSVTDALGIAVSAGYDVGSSELVTSLLLRYVRYLGRTTADLQVGPSYLPESIGTHSFDVRAGVGTDVFGGWMQAGIPVGFRYPGAPAIDFVAGGRVGSKPGMIGGAVGLGALGVAALVFLITYEPS